MLNEILKCGYVIKRKERDLLFLEKKSIEYDNMLQGEIDVAYNIIYNRKLNCYKSFDDINLSEDIKANNNKGFVYLIKLGKKYKIGFTKNIVQRMTFFENTLPDYPELINYIITEDYKKIELKIHKLFKDKRDKNEWFLLNEQDLYLFDKIKNHYF